MVRAFMVAITLSVVLAGSTTARESAAGIQATGIGTASAAAQTAHLQFLLGSSVSFGLAPIEFASGTPSAELPPDASFGMATLSEAQLEPVVEAIEAAGVASDAVVVNAPASTSMFGPGGPEVAEIRVTMEQPQPGALTDLVAAVRAIAQRSGLSVFHVGARYETADCADLVQQARVAAIADANLRAEGLAQGLGVVLGELTLASEYPYLGPSGTDDCATAGTSGEFGPYGPGTDPAFDPDATEVTVTVQVTVTYAIEEATEAS